MHSLQCNFFRIVASSRQYAKHRVNKLSSTSHVALKRPPPYSETTNSAGLRLFPRPQIVPPAGRRRDGVLADLLRQHDLVPPPRRPRRRQRVGRVHLAVHLVCQLVEDPRVVPQAPLALRLVGQRPPAGVLLQRPDLLHQRLEQPVVERFIVPEGSSAR